MEQEVKLMNRYRFTYHYLTQVKIVNDIQAMNSFIRFTQKLYAQQPEELNNLNQFINEYNANNQW